MSKKSELKKLQDYLQQDSKEEIIDLIFQYDLYIKEFYEDGETGKPMTFIEFAEDTYYWEEYDNRQYASNVEY